jgi:polysaccharide export outer membrane protein
MAERRSRRLASGIAIVLGLCAAGTGCNTFLPREPLLASSTGPAPQTTALAQSAAPEMKPGAFTRVAANPSVLQPRSRFQWTIESAEPRQSMTGESIVGPDGTAPFGPFGTHAVAGLTVEQARRSVEQRLTTYMRGPKVQLRPIEVTAADWRVAVPATPAPRQAAQTAPAQTEPVAQAPAPAQQGIWRAVPREEVTPVGLMVPPASDAPGPLAVAPTRRTAGQFATVPGLRPTMVADARPIGPTLTPTAPSAQPAGEPIAAPKPAPQPPPIMVGDNGPMEAPGMVVPGHAPIAAPHAPNEAHRISHPTYVIGPPDILQIDSLEGLLTQPVRGPHLVRPDGTVGVGTYGSVYVAGLTIDQARIEIAKVVHARLDPTKKSLKDVMEGLSVDVLAYNSKVYYVITDRIGFGEVVQRIPITGNETVLDAISQVNGLPPEASRRKIWVARRTPVHSGDNKLDVDWIGITQRGEMATNYQLVPGDRVYVKGQAIQRADTAIARLISPIQRLLGLVLLGSETVNSIRFPNAGTGR